MPNLASPILAKLRAARANSSHAAFVRWAIKHGTAFSGRTPSDEVPEAKAWNEMKQPKAGECFKNAAVFAIEHPDAEYWEGWFIAEYGTHRQHAWAIFRGKVIDFTAEDAERETIKELLPILRRFHPPSNPARYQYFGLHVPTRFVASRLAALEDGLALLTDFYESQLPKRKKERKRK